MRASGINRPFVNTGIAGEFDKAIDVAAETPGERSCPGQAAQRDFRLRELRPYGAQSRDGHRQVAQVERAEDGDAVRRPVERRLLSYTSCICHKLPPLVIT